MKGTTVRVKTGICVVLAAFLLTMAFPALSLQAADEGYNPKRSKQIQGVKVGSVPILTMKHWSDSSPEERYAFLVGFASMLEMEKDWQYKQNGKHLPLDQSLAGSWAKGLQGRSLKNIYDGLNKYVAANPGALDRPLAEVMWFQFVQPKVKEKVKRK